MWYSSLKFCIIFFIFNLTAKNEKSGTRHLQWRYPNEGIIIFFQNIRSLYFRCLKFFFMFTEIFTRTARTKNFDFWALKHNMCWKHIYLFIRKSQKFWELTKSLRHLMYKVVLTTWSCSLKAIYCQSFALAGCSFPPSSMNGLCCEDRKSEGCIWRLLFATMLQK